MRSSVAVSLALSFTTLFTPTVAASKPQQVVGDWEGEAVVMGGALPIRLSIQPGNNGLQGFLDIPQLIYAAQPVELRRQGDELAVTLPFEMGDLKLRSTGQRLTSTSPILANLRRTKTLRSIRIPFSFGAAGPPIKGELILPAGSGPFPVLLIGAGGSNPNRTNWSYTSWSDFFTRLGVGSFVYDRRPDNEQNADGSLYSIEDNARDVAAAVEQIAAHPRVDPKKIGAFGISRGVWLSYTAAALEPRIKLLGGTGAMAVPVAQQELQQAEVQMRADRVPEAELQSALAYLRYYFHVANHLDDWPKLERLVSEVREKPWAKYVKLPSSTDGLKWYSRQAHYDPTPYIERVRVPVFYAWGGDDRIVPPAMNKPLFETLLMDGDNLFKVYPGASHRLEEPASKSADGSVRWMRVPRQYLIDLCTFLSQHGFAWPSADVNSCRKTPGA